MRSAGSSSPTGAAMVAPAKRLPPAGSSSVRVLIGRASGSASTGDVERLVVAAQHGAHAGEVGVVERAAGRLGRRAEVVERRSRPPRSDGRRSGSAQQRRGRRRWTAEDPASRLEQVGEPHRRTDSGAWANLVAVPTASVVSRAAPASAVTGSRRSAARVRSAAEVVSGAGTGTGIERPRGRPRGRSRTPA